MTAQMTQTQLEVLDRLVAMASATKKVADILDCALGILLGPGGNTWGGAYLLEGEQLRLVAQRGLSPHELALWQALPADCILWQGCVRGVQRWVSDSHRDVDALLMGLLDKAAGRALWVLPLIARKERLGFLFASSSTGILAEDADGELLNTLGRVIGLAIDNSRLYEQMEHRLRESQALYEVSRALATTLDLDNLLNLIVHSAVETVDKADNGVLHLLDEKTGELHPRALSFVGQVRPDAPGRSRMRIGTGIAGYALQIGQVVNVPDVSRDTRFIRVRAMRPFTSMLVVPLMLGDRRIGTLSIDSMEANAFTADDERLLMMLATQAAAAIENARLVNDLQKSLRDLKAAQAQLIQSEKLSAIGQLIAGVAHELNNPLTAVMGYAQLLQMSDELPESAMRDIQRIYIQAQRAAKIVQNLLTFARQHKAERHFVDVNEVIERTLELRSYQLRVENIEVITRLDDRVLGTMANASQLQQVFLNLINNAQDAMTEYRGRGRLIVSSELCGDKIQIRFSDNGPGLSATVKQHLFEPFFTTKEVGKGTGLGLSICFGIISQHDGRIWAESEPGKGATFVIELPAVDQEACAWIGEGQDTLPSIRSKRVLVIEDEEDVARLLERILVQDGHQVLLAPNGEAALACLAQARECQQRFDLVISDIKMPGLSGPALYRRIRQNDPELASRVIFVTGDTLNAATQNFLQGLSLPYLAKPFEVDELRRVIVAILGQ